MRQVGRLLNRQSVHVGTQSDRALTIAIAQHADHTGNADTAVDLDAPFLQLARHQIGGPMFVHADLGMGVDVAPNGGEFSLRGMGALEHGFGHAVCGPLR
jgi:hypothetical protein